jgi:hypothetical protein
MLVFYGFFSAKIAYRGRLAWWFAGERWVEVSEWAMQVPACIALSLQSMNSFDVSAGNATDATPSAWLGAFFANLLGSKYQ